MRYIPRKGDIVFINFNPQKGKEQAGSRPAITLSPYEYNKIGLGVFCPITTKEKGYPFEVKLSETLKTRGVVLSDHIKSLDWTWRNIRFIEKADDDLVSDVLNNVEILLFDE